MSEHVAASEGYDVRRGDEESRYDVRAKKKSQGCEAQRLPLTFFVLANPAERGA